MCWKGANYTGRLLVLGESAYPWTVRDSTDLKPPSEDHAIIMAHEIMRDFRQATPFLRKITRALSEEYAPTGSTICRIWNEISFMNYVCEPVRSGSNGHRPSKAQWDRAHDGFLQILNQLKPRRVVVLGYVMWSKMPETNHEVPEADHNRKHPAPEAYQLADGTLAWCQALKHPSRGPSWEEYAADIKAFMDRDLPARVPAGELCIP